jgi:hypothetical protein
MGVLTVLLVEGCPGVHGISVYEILRVQ